LRGELRGAREHREGVLFTDAIEGGNCFQHRRQLNAIIRQRQTPATGMLHRKTSVDLRRGRRAKGFAAARKPPIYGGCG
jgi:hypothetical protein